MKFDIGNLAREGEFSPKLKITSSRLSDGNKLQLFCLGQPWWKTANPDAGHQAMTLIFSNIIRHDLDMAVLCGSSMERPKWKIQRTEHIGWATNSGSQVYCNSPIPHPSSILTAIESVLVSQGSPLKPLDCVGGSPAGTFSGFLSLAKQESFLLCDAPVLPAYEAICEELRKQKVEFNILQSPANALPDLYVEIGRCRFFCDKGSVVVREPTSKNNRNASDRSPLQVAVSA